MELKEVSEFIAVWSSVQTWTWSASFPRCALRSALMRKNQFFDYGLSWISYHQTNRLKTERSQKFVFKTCNSVR